MELENILALEVARHLTDTLRDPMTCRACFLIGGLYRNVEYVPVHIQNGSKNIDGVWKATLDITVVPDNDRGKTASVVSFTEDDLLPWNIVDRIVWPKYPHLFRCFAVPDSDWLETYGSDISYPVRAQAIKLHRGANVMPVGVVVSSSGQHCYKLAVENGNGAFDDFSPTVLYPIGSFNNQTLPIGTYDVAGW